MVRQAQRGFTFIELMLVIAIISILVLLALPAYLNYLARAQVVEGLSIAQPARLGVNDYYHLSGTFGFPTNNNQAGIGPPLSYSTEHVASITVGVDPSDGTVTIAYRIPALGADNLLQLIPAEDNGRVVWQCKPAAVNGVSGYYVPASCRN